MMKKLFLICAISAAASSAAMAAAPYVGGSIGITNNTVNAKIVRTPFTPSTTATIGSYRGVPVNVFGGYGGVIDQNFYLAGEVNAHLATADISNKATKELKNQYGFGVSVIPGIMINDSTLAYGRVGVVREKFDKQKNGFLSKGANVTRTGAQFGVGLQTDVTKNVAIRGEYDYTAYRATEIRDVITKKKVATLSPRSDQFSVGVLYKFD